MLCRPPICYLQCLRTKQIECRLYTTTTTNQPKHHKHIINVKVGLATYIYSKMSNATRLQGLTAVYCTKLYINLYAGTGTGDALQIITKCL